MIRRGFLMLAVLAMAVWIADEAEAAKRAKAQYAVSNSPYWRVGTLNRALSAACQRGEFGQRQHMRLTIGFVGNRGRAVTGIATSTWNLHDPRKLAQPETTYHFFNQGYSNCKVYTAPIPRRN